MKAIVVTDRAAGTAGMALGAAGAVGTRVTIIRTRP